MDSVLSVGLCLCLVGLAEGGGRAVSHSAQILSLLPPFHDCGRPRGRSAGGEFFRPNLFV
ncbi:hypothetical protein PF008_g853 [Phytophthora fragariae]|uniref:RxLR effector protein n=1 Tax=Phytophthora fragariae TaxID=53985 RepID=A0A6G0SMJ2_9STRA|nr:hypothetical protein PF008_g853 [Phytophthora fragariae]